jgi:hypothetical protein
MPEEDPDWDDFSSNVFVPLPAANSGSKDSRSPPGSISEAAAGSRDVVDPVAGLLTSAHCWSLREYYVGLEEVDPDSDPLWILEWLLEGDRWDDGACTYPLMQTMVSYSYIR